MNLVPVDYIFIILIIVFALGGIIKGFVNNICGKLAWILGLILGFMFCTSFSQMLKPSIENELVAKITAFFLIFVAVFLIVKLIQVVLSRLFEFPILKSLDRTLGCFFGIIEGCAIVFAVIFVITVQPFIESSKVLGGSYFYQLFDSFLNSGTL